MIIIQVLHVHCIAYVNGLYINYYQATKFSYFSVNIQYICFGYSKDPSQGDGSFELPKHRFKLIDQKILTIFNSKFCCFYGLCT